MREAALILAFSKEEKVAAKPTDEDATRPKHSKKRKKEYARMMAAESVGAFLCADAQKKGGSLCLM